MKKILRVIIILSVIVFALVSLVGAANYLYTAISIKELLTPFKFANISECERLLTPIARNLCYQEVGISMLDTSVCDKIWIYNDYAQGERELCYREIAIAKQDLSLCAKITNKQHNRDYCYEQIGIVKQDLAICDMVEVNYNKEKTYCYEKVAVAKNDLSICDKINDQNKNEWCYSVVGIIRNDPSICEKITATDSNSKNWQNECFAAIAATNKDSIMCDRIKDQEDRGRCQKDTAAGVQDKEICNRLDLFDRKICYRIRGVILENN